MGTHPVTMSKVELTGPEKGRAFKLFKMLDLDGNGTIEVDEICIVHDSDKDNMIKVLDANGDNQVDKDEWIGYMMVKKGDRKFGFFLNYLEKEIPDKIPAMKVQRAKKAKNTQAKAKAVKSVKRSVKKAKKETKF